MNKQKNPKGRQFQHQWLRCHRVNGITVCLMLIVGAFTLSCAKHEAAEPVESVEPAELSESLLTGSWLRPDGGYVLKLSEPSAEGELNAEYFNPRPIPVAVSLWKRENSNLGVFIKFSGPNYNGSTYTLVYDSASDTLQGIYYQAVMQQQFDVAFERQP